MKFVTEQAKSLPIFGEYDVVVVGGGVAGVAAALSARREGAKTLLIERSYMLGGLATAGLVTIYLPLCDGLGTQVSFGLSEELLRLSIQNGYEGKYPAPWLDGDIAARKNRRYEVQFNANAFAILCEQKLLSEGVELSYGALVCDAIKEGEKITVIVVENINGRGVYAAKSFVDASGDAVLCERAGAKTAIFKQGNVEASWYYEHTGEEFKLHMLGFSDVPDKFKTEERIKADKRRRYTGLDNTDLTELTCNAHATLWKDFLKNGDIDERHALATIATKPQVRMTRKLIGRYALDDTQMHQRFEDSIGMVSDWRKNGPVYELPFGCLYGDEVKNLTVCGRCISVTDDMWDITRVIPDCVVTGEAAGLAAALTDDLGSLPVSILQDKLRDRGVKLHLDEVGL